MANLPALQCAWSGRRRCAIKALFVWVSNEALFGHCRLQFSCSQPIQTLVVGVRSPNMSGTCRYAWFLLKRPFQAEMAAMFHGPDAARNPSRTPVWSSRAFRPAQMPHSLVVQGTEFSMQLLLDGNSVTSTNDHMPFLLLC